MKHVKKFRSNKAIIALALSSVFYLSACGEDTTITSGEGFNKTKDTNTDFNQSALIKDIVDKVITPTFDAFSLKAIEQEKTINDYCKLESDFSQHNATAETVSETKVLAKNSWRSAIDVWQQAEMMQLEPLSKEDSALRDNIYSWPKQNTCGVDLDVTYFKAGTVNGQPYDITKRISSRKSLLALEYLLFNDNLEHTCTGSTKPTSWNNQTEQYRKIARCEYAGEVAKDVVKSSEILISEWAVYGEKLKSAGEAGSEFETVHSAVNKLSDALFYMDIFTKSAKLAEPVGIELNKCGSQPCPEVVESRYSHHSLENIINNIKAFKLFIQGSGADGIGFRDYLINVGDKVTADSLDANIEQVLTSAAAYQSSLAETLVSNPDQVIQTHTEVKNITDKLKSDFITSLALELPKTAAGDND